MRWLPLPATEKMWQQCLSYFLNDEKTASGGDGYSPAVYAYRYGAEGRPEKWDIDDGQLQQDSY